MKKPNPKTATKEEVEQYIKYLLTQNPQFKEAEVTVNFKDKEKEKNHE